VSIEVVPFGALNPFNPDHKLINFINKLFEGVALWTLLLYLTGALLALSNLQEIFTNFTTLHLYWTVGILS